MQILSFFRINILVAQCCSDQLKWSLLKPIGTACYLYRALTLTAGLSLQLLFWWEPSACCLQWVQITTPEPLKKIAAGYLRCLATSQALERFLFPKEMWPCGAYWRRGILTWIWNSFWQHPGLSISTLSFTRVDHSCKVAAVPHVILQDGGQSK